MSNDDLAIIRGSGNVFRDLGHPDADPKSHSENRQRDSEATGQLDAEGGNEKALTTSKIAEELGETRAQVRRSLSNYEIDNVVRFRRDRLGREACRGVSTRNRLQKQ